MEQLNGSFSQYMGYALAALAVWILLRCARSLLTGQPVPEIWGALEFSGKDHRELEHREILIGSRASMTPAQNPVCSDNHSGEGDARHRCSRK